MDCLCSSTEHADRSQTGHGEGDLIVCKNQGSVIGTLVERQNRLIWSGCCPTHLWRRQSAPAISGRPPPSLVRSIIWDQGIEIPLHIEIAADLGPPVCFSDLHPPWRRASNEGSNGLLGQYFPTGTDLNHHSVQHPRAVENELNNRACRVIADRSPPSSLALC
jgi:transposase, IS30 family